MLDIMGIHAAVCTYVDACILLDSALARAQNILLLIERGLSVPSGEGLVLNCLLVEEVHLAPHSFRVS